MSVKTTIFFIVALLASVVAKAAKVDNDLLEDHC